MTATTAGASTGTIEQSQLGVALDPGSGAQQQHASGAAAGCSEPQQQAAAESLTRGEETAENTGKSPIATTSMPIAVFMAISA